MAKTANGRARRPRQGHLEGMEPETIQEIDEAAEEYVAARDSRMALTKEEIKLQDRLLLLMQKHKLTVYQYEGKEVLLAPGPLKVKVKRAKDSEGDGEGEDE